MCLATCSKNFSSNGWNLWICGGGNFRPFLGLGVSKSPWRRGLATLRLWQLLFYSSRTIYPENFKKFRPAARQKHRKGGCPLKQKLNVKYNYKKNDQSILCERSSKFFSSRCFNRKSNVFSPLSKIKINDPIIIFNQMKRLLYIFIYKKKISQVLI